MTVFIGISIVFLFLLAARRSSASIWRWSLIGIFSYFGLLFASRLVEATAAGRLLFVVPMTAVILCMVVLHLLKSRRLRRGLARIGGRDGLSELRVEEDITGMRVGPRRFRTEKGAERYLEFLRSNAGKSVRETPEYELGLFATLVLIWQLTIVAVHKAEAVSLAHAVWPPLVAYGLVGVLAIAAFGYLARNQQGSYIAFLVASIALVAIIEAAGFAHVPGFVTGSWDEETLVFRYIHDHWISDAARAHLWDFSDPKAVVMGVWCIALWALTSVSKALHASRLANPEETEIHACPQ